MPDNGLTWVFKEKEVVTAAFVHLEDAFILAFGGYDSALFEPSVWYGHCKVWDFSADGFPKLSRLKDAVEICVKRKRDFLRGAK